jgi:hypothetical protein
VSELLARHPQFIHDVLVRVKDGISNPTGASTIATDASEAHKAMKLI